MALMGLVIYALAVVGVLAILAAPIWFYRRRTIAAQEVRDVKIAELMRLIALVNSCNLSEINELRHSSWRTFIVTLRWEVKAQLEQQYYDAINRALQLEEYNTCFPGISQTYQAFKCSEGTPAERLALLVQYAERLRSMRQPNNQHSAISALEAGSFAALAQPIIEELFAGLLAEARAGKRAGWLAARQLINDVKASARIKYESEGRFGWLDKLQTPEYSGDWDDLLVRYEAAPARSDFQHAPVIPLNKLRVECEKAFADDDIWLIKLLAAIYASDASARPVIGDSNAGKLAVRMLEHAIANHLPLVSDRQ